MHHLCVGVAAESATLAAVAPLLLQTPTSATSRFPVVMLAAGVRASCVAAEVLPDAC